MRLLARYLLRECLVAFAFCFSAFLMFWIASDLITQLHDLQEKKLRGGDVVLYYIYKTPEFLPIAVPVALLLALLYALTNHARHNEITAIRAAGVSMWRLSLPYFGIAIVSGATLFALNEYVAPSASEMADAILTRRVSGQPGKESRQVVKNRLITNSREGRTWYLPVYNRITGEISSPTLHWQLRDGSVRYIRAKLAVFTNGAWTFFEVNERNRAPGTDSIQVQVPFTNVLTLAELTETPEMINSEISISGQFGNEGRTRRADIPISVISDYLHLHPNPEPRLRAWLYTKLYGRFAAPATCLVVVVLAVPFAAGSGRRNVFVGVAASIVIFFAYYILQQFGFAFAEAGRIPAWIGAWFPNLLVGATGLWLMARVR
ncbi:MAG TPA: LptF/LptG family permease, partial [Candidatus Paceibacterota bacterium]|nr:LptF/LptG family permease [Candidatus Paceibacterota bacterium]